MSDTSKTQELQNWFSVAETERQKLWDTPAKEDKDFYWGRQWTSTEKAKLGEEGRPALTFNEIFPIVNFVSGSQRQNRQDLKVIHKQGGNPITAEIMTMLMKDIEDSCNAPWHISRVFLDGLISRRGYLGFEINYDEDIVNGNLIEKRLKPDRVFIDPSSEEYDHSDAAHMFIIKWQTRKQLELEFPDKKDELTLMTVDAKDKMSQPIPASTGDYEKDTGGAELDKYKLRVKYCYYMTREIVTFLFNEETGQIEQTELTGEILDAYLAYQFSEGVKWKTIRRPVNILHLATLCGNVLLQDIEKPFGDVNRYPIIPFYAYINDEDNQGLISQLKDPQKEVNKRYSQFLHIVNSMANSGWLNPDESADTSLLKKLGAKAGLVVGYKVRKGKPEKIQPNVPSQGHILMQQQGEDRMKRISGVNPDLLGERGTRGEAGIVLELRQKQGNTVLEQVYDNFRLTRVLEGQFIREVIQKSDMYSRQEVIKIAVGDEPDERIQQYIADGGVEKVLNDMKVGKYQTKIDMTTATATVRLSQFYALLEAAKSGLIPIPPKVLIELSDLPKKPEILEELERMEQMQAQMGEQQ